MHTAGPLSPEPRAFQFQMAVGNLKQTASGVDQIAAELIKAVNKKISSEIRKEELPAQWKEPNFVPFYKKGDKTDFINYGAISLLLTAYRIVSDVRLSILCTVIPLCYQH
jgi:hypothetical protein